MTRVQAEMASDNFQLPGMAERGFLPAVLHAVMARVWADLMMSCYLFRMTADVMTRVQADSMTS